MESIWKNLVSWWQQASPKKRWTLIGLSVGSVCTILLFVLTNSHESASAAAQSAADRMDNPLYYVGVIAKTIGVLLLIIGGAIVLKRVQRGKTGIQSERTLSVVESIRVSPKQAMHLVRVGEKYFLVGATDQSLNLISQVDPFGEIEKPTQSTNVEAPAFDELLEKATRENK